MLGLPAARGASAAPDASTPALTSTLATASPRPSSAAPAPAPPGTTAAAARAGTPAPLPRCAAAPALCQCHRPAAHSGTDRTSVAGTDRGDHDPLSTPHTRRSAAAVTHTLAHDSALGCQAS